MAEKYVIVRREPDARMTEEGYAKSLSRRESMPPDFPAINAKIYTAMVDASPSPVSIEEIVEVLAPFARYVEINDLDEREDDDAIDVPVGDLRRARSLLSRLKEMEEGKQ
jgi:hypothetical protein